ncbi:NADH-quinone oxidoreductase subunit C [Streptomyces lunaelactis]|uniref:hydrogenase large subunit n=14 Tax=Streptomyces lunaelactis TaxID=1535768 RepID=UPI001584805C|nr:NADH-quinone oxidoreductase subunit C [Streptomyces lunaelactis]NUK03356.1 NADH-quinone oxidoreductase subunit C [Streptomyces lunaelactis]NUK34894.1 NADH-quinone oxidoreductase subunit C [Streptomyces lunaelactis]NUK66188.1 NADH-quinone oxidoreductase subunit C [Streptomyces lunaelactis]NUK75105.1 NADH-quinone oxidoreductase subunit C [Streptomyces lunaelactis]NUK82479.1 NADH-quinone oxidoreductase subunit C [Streptomyces lunaelactis]
MRTVHEIPTSELPQWAAELLRDGHRLALVAAHHDEDRIRVVYLFVAGPPDVRTELHVLLGAGRPEVPTLAHLSFPAGRFEREMRDLFGIVPLDHPMPRRLVRHFHWPRGWYPMLPDAGPPPPFAEQEGPYPFLEVEGDGVYEIPVGPVHAGLIEPGHFRFSVVGETILKLKARLWFVHKGIEKLFQGRSIAAGLPLAERISGDTAVGHALAYCLAVEEATGMEVPAAAQRARAMLLELERLHNHVADLGMLCNDVGHGVLNAHAQRVREQLLRLNAQITGHRLLRGGVVPGGAALHALPDPGRLEAIGADIREIAHLALDQSTVRDRFTGTAVLTADAARDIGCLGYVARASGLPGTDARIGHPFVTYDSEVAVPIRSTGDVLARFLVRAEEIYISLALIEHLTEGLTPGAVLAPVPAPGAGPGTGVGIAEGWRGTITTRIELGPDGTLSRVKPVDPSFFNWPALPVALTDTIVPDFPLTNKSFNLSYAGNDL